MTKSRLSPASGSDANSVAAAKGAPADAKGSILLDQRLFILDPDRYDAFMRALDNPPAPRPKLRSLLGRVPAWQK